MIRIYYISLDNSCIFTGMVVNLDLKKVTYKLHYNINNYMIKYT